ncbi:IclR family transcriptional regulator [Mycobacterium basiliense]|nr:IclR family transcriptional regulator [Mycobacterium basiliense]
MDSTLLKGLRVLECLARSGEPRRVTDVARELELARSNVHRTLATLVEAGYVDVDPQSHRYTCTLRLFELGSRVAEGIEVKSAARPFMQTLGIQTQETVHLAVLRGAEVVYLDKVESPQPVRAYSSVGGRAPAHCVASGKALLSALSMDQLASALPGEDLPRWTGRTIPTMQSLKVELAKIRDRGYADNRGEWRADVGGIAASVSEASGAAVAAIGISGPIERVTRHHDEFRDAVVAAAQAISRALGYVHASGS